MEAMIIRQHGGIEQITLDRNFPDPKPEAGEVVVKVGATSLNYHDLFTLKGMPGIKVPMPMIMGIDVAGTVAALGAGVSGWKVGARPDRPGRPRALPPARRDVRGRPRRSGEGARPSAGAAARRDLLRGSRLPAGRLWHRLPHDVRARRNQEGRARAHPRRERRGRHLLRAARQDGGRDRDRLRQHRGQARAAAPDGADHGINYVETDFVDAVHKQFGKPRFAGDSNGVDVVVNFTGGDTWVKSMRCLHKNGRLLTCGATAGFNPPTDIRYIWSFELNVIGSNGWERQDLLDLLSLTESGKIRPAIDHVFPLHQAREAFAKLEKRDVCGKVLVKP